MNWNIEGQLFEVDLQKLNEEWTNMEDNVRQSGRQILYITIDGEEFHSDYLSTLSEYGTSAQDIVIHTGTLEQMCGELAISVIAYIEQAKPHIESLANAFYKKPESDAWNSLAQLTEALDWLQSAAIYFHSLEQAGELQESIKLFQEKQVSMLMQFEVALINQDILLVADMLKYETIPVLNLLQAVATNLAKKYEESYVS